MIEDQTQTRRIGDVTYHVIPLPAGKALVMSARLARFLMPVIGEAATLLGHKGDKLSVEDLFTMTKILDGMLDGLNDDAITYLYETLAPTTQAERGEKKVQLASCFDEHFRGRLLECFQWLRFCLEVNFGPLFEGLGKMVADAVPASVGGAAPAPSP